jgi:phosphoserine phosphatase
MEKELTISLIALLIARELWEVVKKAMFSKDDSLKANTEATIKNTLAIAYLREDIAKLHKLPLDVNEAFGKIRAIEDRVKNLEN